MRWSLRHVLIHYYHDSSRYSLEADACVHLAGGANTDQYKIEYTGVRIGRAPINYVGKDGGEADQTDRAQPYTQREWQIVNVGCI